MSLPFQDPNADTEWNDILRKKGILPPRESLKELEKAEEEKEEELLQQSVGELPHPLPFLRVCLTLNTNCQLLPWRGLWARAGRQSWSTGVSPVSGWTCDCRASHPTGRRPCPCHPSTCLSMLSFSLDRTTDMEVLSVCVLLRLCFIHLCGLIKNVGVG